MRSQAALEQKPRVTVTSSLSGAPAPRRRSTRRALATGLAALLLTAVAIPAAATTPTPTATAAAGEVELVLSPSASGVLRSGQALTVTVTLANDTSSSTAASTVSLALGTSPLADRGALNAWLDGEGTDEVAEVASEPLAALSAGGTSSTSLTVAADDAALAERAPGVYPLRATAVVDGVRVADTSAVVVPAADAASSPVAVVVPITAGTSQRGVLGTDDIARLTGPDGDLTAQLDAVQGTGAILAIDPAIPAAIRVLGTAAPATAREWLERLEALPNGRFALQFGDADPSVQVRAGLPELLEPTSLQAYMDAANFTAGTGPTPTASPSPTPTAAAGGPVYPDLAFLTAVGEPVRDAVYWPAGGSADAAVLGTLAGLGTDADTALTLIPSDTVSPGAAVPARASSAGAELLVYDSGVSTALAAAAGSDDAASRSSALATATAELAFATADLDGRPLLVTVDRGTGRDRAALRAALATLTASTTPVSLDALASSASQPVEVTAADTETARVVDVEQLRADEADIGAFATILADPALLTGPERAELLQLLAVAWNRDEEAAEEAVAAHRAGTVQTLNSVGILATNVTLASYGSELRPYVRNDLPYPIELVLVANPDDPRLIVEQRTAVTAQGASNTRVEVPVEAQVGNGTVTIAMQLYSPTGVPIGTGESATVDVHAEWETIGLVVLIILMVLFIGLGIFRTVRSRRAKRIAAGADAEPVDDPDRDGRA